MNQKFEVDQRVVRTKGDYVVGRTGTVIEIDDEKKRVRVSWDGEARTWVSFTALADINIPYEITRIKTDQGGKVSYPKYVRK